MNVRDSSVIPVLKHYDAIVLCNAAQRRASLANFIVRLNTMNVYDEFK